MVRSHRSAEQHKEARSRSKIHRIRAAPATQPCRTAHQSSLLKSAPSHCTLPSRARSLPRGVRQQTACPWQTCERSSSSCQLWPRSNRPSASTCIQTASVFTITLLLDPHGQGLLQTVSKRRALGNSHQLERRDIEVCVVRTLDACASVDRVCTESTSQQQQGNTN
jgi:hypothetical protein